MILSNRWLLITVTITLLTTLTRSTLAFRLKCKFSLILVSARLAELFNGYYVGHHHHHQIA